MDQLGQLLSSVLLITSMGPSVTLLAGIDFSGWLLAADPAGSQGSQFVEVLRWGLNMLIHLDDELEKIANQYGVWSHLILFLVIFCETGLVVTPFLPGDSLLFAAGMFAARGIFHIEWLIPLLLVAAVLGDTVNYWMGRWIGEHAFSGKIPFLKRKHLDETHRFFEKHGGKAIILARFVPLIRTFAPFVAGMGSMNYRLFLLYNVVGGVCWVIPILSIGWLFGSLPIVKNNFELIILGIVGLSVLPILWEVAQHWFAKPKNPAT